jgi:hypothetical protein
MKKTYALGITVIAVLITVAIEESRISAIREELMATRKEGPPKLEQTASAQVMEESPAPAKTKSRPEDDESGSQDGGGDDVPGFRRWPESLQRRS